MQLPIYMDHHATTPVDQRVVDAMLPYLCEKFGNISSSHCFGREVRSPCLAARTDVANLIGADPSEIIFTSGATESNNTVLKGIAEGNQHKGRHLISSVTEHKSILDTLKYLEGRGFDVTLLPVDSEGRISAEQVGKAVRSGKEGTTDRTTLVSLMGANNEIGTLHPMEEIGSILKDLDVLFHVDGAQTAGKVPFDVKKCHIDFLSISGHKIYGPKGIGALYIRDCAVEEMNLVPLLHGGSQEGGLRAGTLPVHLVVGIGRAAQLCAPKHLEEENKRLSELRDALYNGIKQVTHVTLNGHKTDRLPGNLNLTFHDIDSELLELGLKDIAISSTSACSAGSAQPSYVLTSIGRSDEEAFSSIRFGLGRSNTLEEVEYVIGMIAQTVKKFAKVVV